MFVYCIDFSCLIFFSHTISGEEIGFNEILSRCQVKKSLNIETNMSVAYGADRQIIPLKRNINMISAESDIKTNG